MLLLLLFSLVCSKRTTGPITKQLFDQIPHTNYAHNIDSTLLLQYNSYPGVYSMELGEVIDGKYVEIQQNVSLDPFTLPGCNHFQRRLIHQHLADQVIDSDELTFTDMYVDDDIVFVTRNDNALLQFQIQLDYQNKKVTGLQLKETHKNEGFSQQHKLICHKKVCIIFGEEGQTFLYQNNNFTSINLKSIIGEFREFPKDVYFDEKSKLIYVCYDNQIVDVFQFTISNSIEKIKTINAGEKIIQIRTNSESTILYLLDQQKGLISYQIFSILEYKLNSFEISLQNGITFDFYQNTFFIVAETQDGIPYAIEVLSYGNTYYFNKIYAKDMDIYDVWVGEHFAILIGAEVHRVIYHSVYNKFIVQSEIPLYFQNTNLVNVEEFKQWENVSFNQGAIDQEPFLRVPLTYKQSFMVGISENQLSVFSIKSLLPWVQCKPISSNSIEYSLRMNSTSCQTKQIENDHTAFKQCVINHNFSVTGKQIYLFEEDHSKVIIIGGILIGSAILLILFCIIGNMYWNHRIKQAEELAHIIFNDQQELQNMKP